MPSSTSPVSALAGATMSFPQLALVRRGDALLYCASRHEAPAMHLRLLLAPATAATNRLRLVRDGALRRVGAHGMHEDDMVRCGEIGAACRVVEGQQQHMRDALSLLLLEAV